MSNDSKQEHLLAKLKAEQKTSDNMQNNIDEVDANTSLLMEESKENQIEHVDDQLNDIDLLKVELPQSNYSNKSHGLSHRQPHSPLYLISHLNNCVMFPSPQKKDSDHNQPTTMSLASYPSNLIENMEQLEKEDDENIEDWIEKYYLTTSRMTMFFLQLLRFIRMACVILPVISMVGSLFTHTDYINFIIKETSLLWALIPGIEKNSSLAGTLGGTTISIIAFITVILICRFLWSRLIKQKFLSTCAVGLKAIKGRVLRSFTYYPEKLAEHMLLSGIIGNGSNPVLKKDKSQLTPKTSRDCNMLYQKYSTLIQRYNFDRMGPYDIAKERQASQFRLLSVFLLLVVGIGSDKYEKNDTFMGHQINHAVIYNILLGMLEDAWQQSEKDHRKSKYFTWVKKMTKSRYALMLKTLIEDMPDKHAKSLEMYKQCLWIQSDIMLAETQAKYVGDNEYETQQLAQLKK